VGTSNDVRLCPSAQISRVRLGEKIDKCHAVVERNQLQALERDPGVVVLSVESALGAMLRSSAT
jgi:hypothetical protein